MDKIPKALKKLTHKERERVKELLGKIEDGDVAGLDLKKLKGRGDVFRVRMGNVRIIFWQRNEDASILAIERRSEDTYKRF